MKNYILSFILGVTFTILVAAGTQSITISQPAMPKQVFTKSFRAVYGLENDIKEFIDQKVKEGWIVKSVAMMDDETLSKGIVVLEKY